MGFNFLLDSVSSKTEIVEEVENDGLKIRIEKIKDSEEESDPENTEIQKLLRGERPLLEVDDLRLSQKETEGFGDAGGQEKYSFKYLYERTVRSFINNRFYEIFPIELLVGEGSGYEGYSFFNLDADSIFAMPCVGADGSYEWILPFSNSVSDFHILKKLSDAKKPKDPDVLEPPVETKHNLTHISNTYKFFGLTECGFNEEKVEFDSLLDREAEDNDKLVKEKFNTELNEVFYFYILGISKFVQDYLFLVKYKNSVIPIIKKIPVIASQVGLPDPEVSYKWKSKCSIYTYLYDTGLNPFTKVSDVDNLDFFINPFYIIVHKDFRDDKYEGTRTATNDYGFLFGTNWWVKYKQRLDKFSCKSSQSNNYNAFLDVYMTLAETDSSIPTEEDIIKGFSKAKSVLYIELGSIDYVYSSYCGDHDFTLGNTTPYLYDRAADQGLTSGFEDPRSDRVFNFVYSTGGYDKKGIGMRRSRPCSRFVGPMWFPFRACEVVRYNEFADYPGLRYLIDSESNIYHKILRGFSCTDLIFKPYPDSDFDYLFIDDCFGCINPYRYTSSFYSIDVLNYYDSSGSSTTEVAPTYLASNASVPWRSIPIFYNEKYMVFTNSHEYTINNIGDKIPTSLDGFEKYVDLNLDTYSNFKVGDTSLSVCKESEPVPGETRSILYNCLLDTPPILPYNHSRNKYICGYERMRGGDAHFIYQCIYPYHHSTPYLPGCKHIADYENKGEECYGKVENTLLPHVLPVASDASMTVLGSVFYPAIWARFFCGGYMLEHMPCPVPNSFSAVKDWLASPGYIHIYNCWNLKTTLLESENDVFWNHFDTLGCKTDGPDIMKACYNHYVGECKGHIQGKEDSDFCNKYDYNGLMFVDKNTNCTECFEVPKCESVGKIVIDSFTHSETNLTSRPLYYHFANDWAGTYDYVLLGASMKSKPTFYGDGAFRMYKDYDELKKIYTIFNKNFEVSNVAALPMFGGLGRFFRMCYFSTNYGKVPFSTLSGIATNTEDEDEDRDDNYVYKLSGYINSDTMFDNNFEYGYLPEKNLVVTVDDMYMFTSLFSFIEDDTIKLETRNCVRFEDLIEYVEVEQAEDCYYLYKGADIKIKTFGGEEDIESGPALAVMYDNNVLNKDKYNYYSEYGTKIFIADPVFGDVKIIDPFPFGDNVVISCERLKYSQGYLNGDVIKLEIKGLNIETTLEIKVKDSDSGGQAWKLYVETEKEVTNKEGDKETKSVESQIVYLCYDDGYNIGSLVVRDNDDEMLLTTHDVINVGDIKYKINRGFYLDFSNMLLPYEEYNTTCGLYNLTKAGFVPVGGGDCYCAYGYNTSGADGAPYIIIPTDACFIISLEGSFFSAKKYGELGVVGYICLETSEEYYAIGNLYVRPEFESGSEDTYKEYSYQNTTAVRYRYYFHFIPYKNYNKIKYCGAKYRFIFSDPAYFCVPSNNTSVTVKYGKFNGGELCKVTFNEVSSLKAITYSKEIEDAIGGNLSGINLYYENLNDKLMLDGNATFYTMPFGFIHKLDGGIAEDKEVEFKEGYFGEFKQSGCNYSEDEQKQKDRIELPVERDIFDLIHYSTCFVRFCLKSKFYNISTEATIDLNTSLVPDLYSSFGYVPIKQWAAPGHKLDLYPDSLYAGYMPAPSFEQQVAKAFANTSSLDSYKNDLNVLACKEEIDPPKQCSFKKLLDSIGVDSEIPSVRRNGYIIMPHNMCFITHVAHGMFGYPDITDVSDWIETPGKPAIYGIYDENEEEE